LGSEIAQIQDAIRTSCGLRDILFEEIDTLRAGKSSVARARAIARLADKILGSVNLEIGSYSLSLGLNGKAMLELPGIKLGTNHED
jgi:hypothetical protein